MWKESLTPISIKPNLFIFKKISLFPITTTILSNYTCTPLHLDMGVYIKRGLCSLVDCSNVDIKKWKAVGERWRILREYQLAWYSMQGVTAGMRKASGEFRCINRIPQSSSHGNFSWNINNQNLAGKWKHLFYFPETETWWDTKVSAAVQDGSNQTGLDIFKYQPAIKPVKPLVAKWWLKFSSEIAIAMGWEVSRMIHNRDGSQGQAN